MCIRFDGPRGQDIHADADAASFEAFAAAYDRTPAGSCVMMDRAHLIATTDKAWAIFTQLQDRDLPVIGALLAARTAGEIGVAFQLSDAQAGYVVRAARSMRRTPATGFRAHVSGWSHEGAKAPQKPGRPAVRRPALAFRGAIGSASTASAKNTCSSLFTEWDKHLLGKWSTWREEAKQAYDFAAGHQWDPKDRAAMMDNQEKSPVVFNITAPTLGDAVAGKPKSRTARRCALLPAHAG